MFRRDDGGRTMSKRTPNSGPASPEDVDSYLAGLPEPAQETLEKVRRSIRAAAPEAEESISYQIPTYKRSGRPLIYYAAFKNHWSLFPMSEVLWSELRAELEAVKASKTGKGTVQFPFDSPIPGELVKKIVRFRVKELESGQED